MINAVRLLALPANLLPRSGVYFMSLCAYLKQRASLLNYKAA